MLNLHISYSDMLGLLTRAVTEKGEDFNPDAETGNGCVYGAVGSYGAVEPRCIVGYVFHYLGILRLLGNHPDSLYDLCWVGGIGTTPEAQFNEFSKKMEEWGITMDREAWLLAHHAQSQQDQGIGWGTSVSYARTQVKADFLYEWAKEPDDPEGAVLRLAQF